MVWSATAGAGSELVVLVHGSLDRSAGLLKLSRRLDGRFRVTRYDRRGYGRSVPHDGPFTMSAQVDDLAEVIAAEPDHERCVVVGHSYGGNVALALAERAPHLVDAVVTYESPLSWLPWWGGSAGSSAMASRDDLAEAAELFMRRLIGDERWEGCRRRPGPHGAAKVRRCSASWPISANTPRGRPIGSRCRCWSCSASTGSRITAAVPRRWPTGYPTLRLEMVPDARHFGPNTHPDDVAARIVRFIGARLKATNAATAHDDTSVSVPVMPNAS
ncbi:MAG: alpha/beta hydrolase [Ilumatobacteraceae bacterium]